MNIRHGVGLFVKGSHNPDPEGTKTNHGYQPLASHGMILQADAKATTAYLGYTPEV